MQQAGTRGSHALLGKCQLAAARKLDASTISISWLPRSKKIAFAAPIGEFELCRREQTSFERGLRQYRGGITVARLRIARGCVGCLAPDLRDTSLDCEFRRTRISGINGIDNFGMFAPVTRHLSGCQLDTLPRRRRPRTDQAKCKLEWRQECVVCRMGDRLVEHLLLQIEGFGVERVLRCLQMGFHARQIGARRRLCGGPRNCGLEDRTDFKNAFGTVQRGYDQSKTSYRSRATACNGGPPNMEPDQPLAFEGAECPAERATALRRLGQFAFGRQPASWQSSIAGDLLAQSLQYHVVTCFLVHPCCQTTSNVLFIVSCIGPSMESICHVLMINRLTYGATVTNLNAVRGATERSAKCLGRYDIGVIAVGRQANLAMYNLHERCFSGADPIAALGLCCAHRADCVMLVGRWLVEDGVPVGGDLDRLRRECGALAIRFVD